MRIIFNNCKISIDPPTNNLPTAEEVQEVDYEEISSEPLTPIDND